MRPGRGCERAGFALVEQLVALATLLLAVTAGLVLFDAARRTFRRAEQRAELQRGARAALHRLTEDLGRAGLRVDPDGAPGRPDEAIEAALDTALVIRGDLDADDPDESAVPERDLEGGAFRNVATGNDEIVAWSLAAPGGDGGDVLEFDADVADLPRDGRPERVRIPRLSLGHEAPPYTLYRITLHPDPGRFGRPGFVVRTPVLENVQALSFRYRDRHGEAMAAPDAPGVPAADGPAARRRRAGVRRIEIVLRVGVRHPDPAAAMRRRRPAEELVMAVDVAPRNLRLPAAAAAPSREEG